MLRSRRRRSRSRVAGFTQIPPQRLLEQLRFRHGDQFRVELQDLGHARLQAETCRLLQRVVLLGERVAVDRDVIDQDRATLVTVLVVTAKEIGSWTGRERACAYV